MGNPSLRLSEVLVACDIPSTNSLSATSEFIDMAFKVISFLVTSLNTPSANNKLFRKKA